MIIHYPHLGRENLQAHQIGYRSARSFTNLFGDKHLSEKVKRQVYTALVLSTSLYGCEVGPFEKICFSNFGAFTTVVPAVCVASASLTLSATASLPKARLGILDLDSYYHNRVLRWAGQVTRRRRDSYSPVGWLTHGQLGAQR